MELLHLFDYFRLGSFEPGVDLDFGSDVFFDSTKRG